jgi:ribosomal protein S18 acetylase RimI-like enzyme
MNDQLRNAPMSWKPFSKLREKAQTKTQERLPEGQWIEQVIVRQVTEEDLPDMEWNGEYSHFRRVYAEAYQRMLRGYTLLWVAELPGTGLVGQVFIQLVCDRPELADGDERAYLYSFRVRDPFRGQGLGSRIMDVVEDDLRLRGFQYVTLNVARDNPRAQQLYLRRGYHVVAPEPGVWSYPDEKGVWHQVEEPAWRMEKYL